MRLVPRRGLLAAAVAALLAPGCGGKVGSAAGRVTYRGKPVVCGSVTFVGPDGMTQTARIGSDGTYSVGGVGAGAVRVAVLSDDPARPLDPYKAVRTHGKEVTEPVSDSARVPDAGRAVAHPPADRSNWAEPDVDRSKWFPLPKKYELVTTSGLTAELRPGPNAGVDLALE
jgi:hypothetical protein